MIVTQEELHLTLKPGGNTTSSPNPRCHGRMAKHVTLLICSKKQHFETVLRVGIARVEKLHGIKRIRNRRTRNYHMTMDENFGPLQALVTFLVNEK